MKCPTCGKNIPDGAKFCAGCGNKLQAGKTATPSKPKNAKSQKPGSVPNTTPAGQVVVPASIANPPPLPQNETAGMQENKSRKSFGRGGFEPIFRDWVFKPYMAIVFVILAVSGALSAHRVSNFNEGEPFSGLYVNEDFNYSMFLSEGWNINKNPTSKTGSYYAIGYFFKGEKRKPDLFMTLYYSEPINGVPEFFSDNDLALMEDYFKDYIIRLMKSTGREYEFLQFTSFLINNRDALWIEGNIKKRRGKKRNFLFLTFEENRTYIIDFTFDEIRTEELWPEIEELLYSIQFE